VIRGVAGSGKTVVLANAVADAFLREARARSETLLEEREPIQVLVVCFNRVLAPLLHKLIVDCFEQRRAEDDWRFPERRLLVRNIDRYAYGFSRDYTKPIPDRVRDILASDFADRGRFDHVFLDEGQDVKLAWYPLIRALARPRAHDGPSIVAFYDEAQNLYGVKRPGSGDAPPWKELLGAVPNPRGLRTVMRVGHRNTNQILSFSFNLLLGAFAESDPGMVMFSDIVQPSDTEHDQLREGAHGARVPRRLRE